MKVTKLDGRLSRYIYSSEKYRVILERLESTQVGKKGDANELCETQILLSGHGLYIGWWQDEQRPDVRVEVERASEFVVTLSKESPGVCEECAGRRASREDSPRVDRRISGSAKKPYKILPYRWHNQARSGNYKCSE